MAAEMIQMIAEKGNRDQKEYAFELAGINFLHNSDAIRIASYAVPASDYRNAQPGYVDYDEEIAKENMTKLAKQTKLDGIFRNYSSSQRDQGDMAGIIHVHHTGLHDRYIGMPSEGDFETALQQIQERDKVHFPWGVVTMKEGNIYMYMAQATLVDTEPTGDTLCKKLPNGKYVVFKPATIYGQHEGQMWHLGQTIDGDWQKRTPLPPPTI